jgi:holo-[acyl-carrier protein] synthase
MRIHGVGTDIVRTARVLRLHERFGSRFLEKAFHPNEAADYLALADARKATFLASRWAVKEALHKALGSKRLLFPDIELVRGDPGGPRGAAPSLRLHGGAAHYQREKGLHFFVSLSHEEEIAVAFVIAMDAEELSDKS